MTILITGTAGFIGFHAAQRLLAAGHAVYGVDNLNAYYDTRLKADRLEQLQGFADFRFQHAHVEHGAEMLDLFQRVKPTRVLHLAAQPGVRYSIDNPWAYAKANLDGFLSILEACRAGDVLRTCADLGSIKQATGCERKVVLAEGLERWVRWFRNYRALQ